MPDTYGDPTLRTMVARALNAYDSADDTVRAQGEEWYPFMRTLCASLAESANLPTGNVAGCMAILSANASVAWNIEMCEAFVEHYRASGIDAGPPRGWHTTDTSERAWCALVGDPQYLMFARTRRGQITGNAKTRCFFRNIMGEDEYVTVDRHIARVLGSTNERQPTARRYRNMANAIALAARRRNIPPAVMQATIWIVTRGSAY